MDNSLQIKEKLELIAKYVPGNASDIARMLGVHPNTLRNMKADNYDISVSTMTKVDRLHKKALRIKRFVGGNDD